MGTQLLVIIFECPNLGITALYFQMPLNRTIVILKEYLHLNLLSYIGSLKYIKQSDTSSCKSAARTAFAVNSLPSFMFPCLIKPRSTSFYTISICFFTVHRTRDDSWLQWSGGLPWCNSPNTLSLMCYNRLLDKSYQHCRITPDFHSRVLKYWNGQL